MLLPYRVALVIVTLALSLPTASLASPLEALSQCLKEGLSADPPMKKLENAHSANVSIDILCHGQRAETLYGAIKTFGDEIDATDDNLNKRHIRFFGGGSHAGSQCINTYETPSGKPMDYFACFIRLDFNPQVVAALGGAL
jgi:hypothetical protein